MRSLFLVLLLAAAPAHAITYRLVGATIDTCTSNIPDDPTPCAGKIGRSLDGTITIADALGPLPGRQLNLWPDELPPLDGNGIPFPLAPNQTYLTNSQFGFGLNFDWAGKADHFAGLTFDAAGNIASWFIGAVLDNGRLFAETASFSGSVISGPDFSATGPSGQFVKEGIGPSPVPLPATAWLMLAGLVGVAGLRFKRRRLHRA
jgi:hypothetical protein